MPSDYSGYFQQLFERVNSAVKVPFREVRADGWEPKLGDCHRNVDFWVTQHPETKAVRGWLFWPTDETGRYRYMAHSVLDENGTLVDITPVDSRDGLLFLKHLGTEEDFSAMKIPCAQVWYPPLTYAEWQESQIVELEGETDFQ
jgi:hypothetical protein